MSDSLASDMMRFFRPRRTDPIQEATEQYLNKQSKLDTALDGVIVNDLHHIGASERDAVERYREKTVFGNDGDPPKKKRKRMGDFIVCDDYRRNDWLSWVATVLAISLLASLLWWGIQNQGDPEFTDTDTDTQFEIYVPDGPNPAD